MATDKSNLMWYLQEPPKRCAKSKFIPWFSSDNNWNDEETNHTGISMGHRGEYNGDYKALKPKDIFGLLRRYVVEQDEALKDVSIMLYQHFQGHRCVSLLAGPTGSGKSFIAESIMNVFPKVVRMRNISNLTQNGWKGNNKVDDVFSQWEPVIVGDQTVHPIYMLDECDKLFLPKMASSENVSVSLQSELLGYVHGARSEFNGRDDKKIIVDTRNVSIMFLGSFEVQAQKKAMKSQGTTIGFTGDQTKVRSYQDPITMEDVIAQGCTPELAGRIHQLINLRKFSEDDFKKILKMKDRGPIREMEEEFDITIRLKRKTIDRMAHESFESEFGMRGAKNQIHEAINKKFWTDPEFKEIEV